MKTLWLVLILAAFPLCVCGYASDFGTYAFPQKGQTQEDQKNDETACAQWAESETGLNPAVLKYQQEEAMSAQQAVPQQSAAQKTVRKIGRGALTGAALGGIDESMDDGAGKGAAMGATLALSKGMSESKEAKEQAAVNQANAKVQKVQADTDTYLRAYCACMEGKGYSIR